jgi:hypothetical protein
MYLLQAEIGWMRDVGLRGWDLAVWGLIVLGVIFLWRVMPGIIRKENKKSEAGAAALSRLGEIEASLAEAKKEREWFNNNTVERLNAISGHARSAVEQQQALSKYTLIAVIYNQSIPPLIRMECLISYLKRGWNGNCLEFAVDDLIMPNKELWQSLFVQVNDDSEVSDKEQYDEAIDFIKKKISVSRRA